MKYKVRIKKAPGTCAYGGQTQSGGLDLNQPQFREGTTSGGQGDGLNGTLQPVPRHMANIEAERGESAVADFDQDGMLEHMKIQGERHSNGGTPLNVPDGTFIFSDTKKMRIGGRALSVFGKNGEGKQKFTPAQLAKQYDLNKYKKILQDPDSDPIAKRTAELMMANNQMKLGQLALLQESMKGFPTGIPSIAMPVMQTMMGGGEESQEGAPQMKMGGNVPQYGDGGGIITYTDEKGRKRTVNLNKKLGNLYVGTINGKQSYYDDYTVNELIKKYGDPSRNQNLPVGIKAPTNTWNGPVFPAAAAPKGQAAPQYHFSGLTTPDAVDSADYRNHYEGLRNGVPEHVKAYQDFQRYGVPPTLSKEAYADALNNYNAYKDAANPTMIPAVPVVHGNQVAVTSASDMAPVVVTSSKKGKSIKGNQAAVTAASNMAPVTVTSRSPKATAAASVTASGDAGQIPVEDGEMTPGRRAGRSGRVFIDVPQDNPQLIEGVTVPYGSLDQGSTTQPVSTNTPGAVQTGSKGTGPVPGDFNPAANKVPFEFMTPDKLRMMAAAQNLAGAKKYLPWEAALNVTTPDTTFYDGSRELASNAEMAAMQMQTNAMMAGPGAGFRNSAVAGQAGQNAANILGRYNNLNAGAANQAAQAQAQAMNMEAEYNVQRANRLYQGNVIANQQFDNSKRMLGNELVGSIMNAWKNRQQMDLMNQTNQYFYVDPRTGRFAMRSGKSLTNGTPAPSGGGNSVQKLAERTKFYKDTYKLSDSVAKDLAEKELGIGRVTTQTKDPYNQMRATGAGYLPPAGYTGYNPYLSGDDE